MSEGAALGDPPERPLQVALWLLTRIRSALDDGGITLIADRHHDH